MKMDLQRIARGHLLELLENEYFASNFDINYLADWYMSRIRCIYVEGGSLIDLGGGFSVVNCVLAKMGMTVCVIDLMGEYFKDSTLRSTMREQFDYLAANGVKFISTDLLEYDFKDFAQESVDVVCSHHCLEHLHHSPKELCLHSLKILKRGGLFFVEVPNSINLLKRIKVLFGRTNYPEYSNYFETPVWRGHIREYSVDDLEYLAQVCGLKNYNIFGLNYYGTLYSKFKYNALARLIDNILRLRPNVCSALYLSAIKP